MSITQSHESRLTATLVFILIAIAFSCHHSVLAQQTKQPRWIGSWATAPMTPDIGDQPAFCDVTLREIAHISVGGSRIRVRLTNEFGISPLTVSAAHIGLSAGGDSILSGTDRVLTFGGETSVRIPAGSIMLSDPVQLDAPPHSDVAVSLYLPLQYIRNVTLHYGTYQTNYLVRGNAVAATILTGATKIEPWYFFDGVDVVSNDKNAGAIVVLGDSITEGAYSSLDKDHRWTDLFSERLQEEEATAHLSVLNEGIGGNRIFSQGTGGPSALARFDRDVLSQSGVKYLIILEGTNDIGHLVKNPKAEITAQQLELALSQMAGRAHTAGIIVYGATMLPFEGAGYYSEKGEEIRENVNRWIRMSGVFDGVIDFDKAMRDPNNPKRLLPAYDHGDHLHPNEAGYKAMSDAVNLNLFR